MLCIPGLFKVRKILMCLRCNNVLFQYLLYFVVVTQKFQINGENFLEKSTKYRASSKSL